jgi:hypothetical protein
MIRMGLMWCLLGLSLPTLATEPTSVADDPEASETSVPEEASGSDVVDPVEAPPVDEGSPADAASDDGDGVYQPGQDEISEEVLVIGNQVIAARRDDVVRSMEDLGWKARRRRDGIVTFRPPQSWMGKAHLLTTGDLDFTQPVLAFNGARNAGGGYDNQNARDNDQQAGTVGVSVSPLPDRRVVRSTQVRIRETMADSVMAYRRAIQGQHLARVLQEIPDRLDGVWTDGLAYDGTVLSSVEDRRAWILAYWATRTATPEGLAVCRVIEAWLREVIQLSDHPITDAERKATEARRSDGRPLKM